MCKSDEKKEGPSPVKLLGTGDFLKIRRFKFILLQSFYLSNNAMDKALLDVTSIRKGAIWRMQDAVEIQLMKHVEEDQSYVAR